MPKEPRDAVERCSTRVLPTPGPDPAGLERPMGIRTSNATNGSTDLKHLARELRKCTVVGVCVAIDRLGTSGRVCRISIDARPDLICPDRRWRYDVLELVSYPLAGPRVADWFSPKKKAATIGPVRFTLPAFQGTFQWRWNSSYASFDVVPWPMPHMNFEIPWQTASGWSQFGNLVSIDAPGYLSADQAVSEFFDGGSARNSPPFDQCRVRLAETDAWIDQVHIKPTSVGFEIQGESVDGCRLEFNSPLSKAERRLSAAGVTEFEIPHGLPDSAWAVLSKSGRLLDNRRLGPPWSGLGETIEPPPLTDQLGALIAGGEGPTSEFKVQMPANPKERQKVAATVAAFANGDGGIIVIGVDNDTLAAVTLGITARHLDTLHNVLRNLVHPQPDIEIEKVAIDGRTVAAIIVKKGLNPPYGIHANALDIYVRRGANTVRARHEEIVSLAAPPVALNPTRLGRILGG